MTGKLKTAFYYWLIWILIFQLARLAFSLYNIELSIKQSVFDLMKSFLYGLRMDISMSSYILIPFCVFQILGLYMKAFSKKEFYFYYSSIILLPVLLIVFCDLPAYQAWGYRLDATPLKYLQSPKEAWASVSHLPVFWIILFFTGTYFLLLRFFKSFLLKNSSNFENNNSKYAQTFIILLFSIFQIIPLRGGVQLAPLNQSSVYFSSSNYLNLAAINVTWNFVHSIANHTGDKENPYKYLTADEALHLKNSLYQEDKKLNTLFDTTSKPNIILIVWESFTKKVIDKQKYGTFITPGFNQLKKEGVYFSDIYATGDRTDKGIVAVLSGYPAQPTTSIVTIPQKAYKLPKLPLVFKQNNYSTSFYYGGELEFANMKAYLMGCGFDEYVSKADFDEKDQNSKWGAHDHIVKDRLMQDLRKKQSPFFTTWLTLSSHEPFETPVNTVIQGDDEESMFLNSIHYTDSTIYSFVEQCKKEPFWKNTIIVIMADHGHRMPQTNKKIDDFKIPELWLGGALKQKCIEIKSTGSQIDMASTLLSQLNLNNKDFSWSKNLSSASPKQWAYFSFNNGFGFTENNQYFIFDNVGKSIMEKSDNISDSIIKKGKAIQQLSFGDYLSK